MISNAKEGLKRVSGQAKFKLTTSTAMVAMALASMSAIAGPGRVCLDGTTVAPGQVLMQCADNSAPIGTYYANSPKLRKFVDTVAGLTSAGANTFANNAPGEYISVAEPDLASFPGSEYFVIGVIEHEQLMHSDLQKPTTQRSYVQLYPSKADGGVYDPLGKPVAPASSAYASFGAPPPGVPQQLFYPGGTKAITWPDGSPVWAYDKAHYLGPVILTPKGTPVRVKFVNFLPNGSATVNVVKNSNGTVLSQNVVARNGDMFLPTDESLAGAGLSEDNTNKYPQNRVAFHLHGGDSPWISDGTPHQWIAASGEKSLHQHGDRFMNTPDMPYPGDGAQTTFWPNDQSNRLMWYHDHTFGLTRQNAYSGAAAGYVIYDAAEVALIYGGTVNGVTINKAIPNTLLEQIVLVVQDKTFVPNDIAVQDSKWDQTAWGKPGDLWYPHVYEPIQVWDKGGNLGTTTPGQLLDINTVPSFLNPAGRWDYGIDDATGGYRVPNAPLRDDPDYGKVAFPDGTYFGGPSATPESYMDTPVVNGIAYPVMNVDPKAYRVRFLNGANDRYWNLSLWVADAAQVASDGRTNTEIKTVPADGTAVFKLANGTTVAPADGRPGGVPDPTAAGPNIIRFANEGGLLQHPVVHTPKPMTGFQDVTAGGAFTLARDSGDDFYLGGAERADTVIDFSQYAGKTLILYNDSSAPVPGGDDRYDYYTDGPDQTAFGGAPKTAAGFGPNTRTVMQIVVAPKVKGATAAPTAADAWDPLGTGGPLAAELPKAYAASADAHILADGTLPTHFDATSASMTLNGKTVPLKVKTIRGITDPNFGRLIAQIGIELPNGDPLGTPLAYIDKPTDIISDGETQYWWIKNNDVDNHPMHFHLFNVQVVARIDQTNGAIIAPQPDETGWKETIKNWPLEDVIVAIKPKTPALPFGLPKSVRNLDPTLPVGASNSSFNRPGADLVSAFLQTDLVTGAPVTTPVVNSSQDFDWEYVWHCHILGHEENDLMRPLVFHPAPPTVPATLPGTVAVSSTGKVSWTDPTPSSVATTKGNTANEIGFRVERATVTTTATGKPVAGAFAALAPNAPVVDGRVNTQANATSFQDAPAAFTDYQYRVVSVNEAGGAVSSIPAKLAQAPAAPTGLTAAAASTTTLAAGAKTATTAWSVNLKWTDAATNETGYVVRRATGTINQRTGLPTWGTFANKPLANSLLAANSVAFVDGPTGVAANTLYQYQVYAMNGALVGPVKSAIVASAANLGVAPNQLQATGAPTTTSVGIQWQNTASTLATGYEVQRCVGTATACQLATAVWIPVPSNTITGSNNTQFVANGLTTKTTYSFRVRAINNLVPAAVNGDPGLVSPWSKLFATKTL